MRRFSILTGLAVLSLSCAGGKAPASHEFLNAHPELVDATYCVLTARPNQFDSRLVRTTATWGTAFELSVLKSAECPDRSKWSWTGADPSVLEQNSTPRVLRRFRTLRNSGLVQVTVVGVFHGPRTHLCAIGRQCRLGYGHLNGYDYQFDVLAIESADPALDSQN